MMNFKKNRVSILPKLLIAVGLSVCLSACQKQLVNEDSQEDRLPNIVFILADDLGYGDVGAYGATMVKTPNIDRLAQEGRLFTDAHSASAVCTPSRYALMTGEYPYRSDVGVPSNTEGAWGPLPTGSELVLDVDSVTVSSMLRQKGYKTAAIGKWHMGFKEGSNDWQVPLSPGPRDVGFDFYYGLPGVNSGSPYVLVENETMVGYDPEDPLVYIGRPGSPEYEAMQPIQPSPIKTFSKEASKKSDNLFAGALEAHELFDDEQLGTVFTNKALEWMDENKEHPFFLYFSTTQIHHPFTPAPRFKGTSEIGLYGDFIHELDWMVGEIMTYLDDNGLSENTLVVFTSDNGGMLNLGGRNAVEAGHLMNGNLLGFKFGAWEGGHRVPFITRWPSKITAGQQSDQLISLVDMLASFAVLTGQEALVPEDSDSVNVLPALLGETDKVVREELLIAPRHPSNLSLRDGKWVYIPAKGSGGFTGSKPDDHAWGGPAGVHLVGGENNDMQNGLFLPSAAPAQLYDLVVDPYQTTNLYSQHPDIVARMEARLSEFLPREKR